MEQRSTWESIKTLFSPKTIPFLISQGVPRKLLPVGTLLLGLALGFLWAYVISPNVYTSAGPVHLSADWKEEFVKAVAWQYSASGDAANAAQQLGYLGDAADVLAQMVTTETDPQLVPRLQALQPIAQNNPNELGRISSTLFNSNLTPYLCLFGLGLILTIVIVFNTIIPIGLLFQGKSTAPSTVTPGVEQDRRKVQAEAMEKLKQMDKEATPAAAAAQVDMGPPVARFMSSYIMGDDFFDDSFSIETPTNEFLGETGAGISKTIGVGDPKKVTAVEVWVFDKNDIRTVTKVLMSEHAYNDEGIRAELAPKGEAVVVRPGEVVTLDTQTLTVQARIIDMAYGTGALPPNSFFERLSIQISAWPKKPAAVPDSSLRM